jgi:hypothetical protein
MGYRHIALTCDFFVPERSEAKPLTRASLFIQ